MIVAQQDLKSIHALSAELQYPSRSIEIALAQLHLAPALRLNGLLYLDHEQAESVAEYLRTQGK